MLMVALSQSTYPWWSFQASWEAGLWLTLRCCNVRWEPQTLQPAARHGGEGWQLQVTSPSENWVRCWSWRLCPGVSTKSLWIENAPAERDAALPCCFGVSFLHGPKSSSLKWPEVLQRSLPLPAYTSSCVKVALWWASPAPTTCGHWFTGSNNLSPLLGGPVT